MWDCRPRLSKDRDVETLVVYVLHVGGLTDSPAPTYAPGAREGGAGRPSPAVDPGLASRGGCVRAVRGIAEGASDLVSPAGPPSRRRSPPGQAGSPPPSPLVTRGLEGLPRGWIVEEHQEQIVLTVVAEKPYAVLYQLVPQVPPRSLDPRLPPRQSDDLFPAPGVFQ